MNVYPFIEAERAERRNVSMACASLEVSRVAFYEWHKHLPSTHELTDAELLEKIKAIFDKSKGRYGSPRVHNALKEQGVQVAKKRVARLMRETGLVGRAPRRFRKTTIPGPETLAAIDLIKRSFGAGTNQISRAWCGDITYVRTWEGWFYLASVIDIGSRRVVGYAMADHMRTELVADALRMALDHRRPPAGLIFHSDRGCQGELKGSSQHLEHGGVDGHDEGAAEGGAAVSRTDPVARAADGGLASGPCSVLGRDRTRREDRGRGRRGRCTHILSLSGCSATLAA